MNAMDTLLTTRQLQDLLQTEVKGQIVAAVHAGQFLARSASSEGKAARRLAEVAAAAGIDEQKLCQALARVPLLGETRRQQVPRLLQRVGAAFSEIGTERLELMGRLHRIAKITQS
jgi:hypothetical protein